MSSDEEPIDTSAAVAEAEAELKAAQEKLAAAKAKLSDEGPADDDRKGSPTAQGGSTAGSQSGASPNGDSDQDGSAVPPQQPHYGYQQPYRQQTYANQPVTSSKDHVAAGLLAIFLGSLGIHKFYLGYNTPGFIMLAVTVLGSLVTFGLAGGVVGVIAIIEGILYLTKSQSEFEQVYVFGRREWF